MQKRLAAPDASFDAPLGASGEEGSRTRHDVMEGAKRDRPDEAVEESQFHSVLKSKLDSFADTLDGREERIFRGRWLAEEPMKLRQLGAEFGVSRERARQIEKRLLGRVREYLVEELGTAVDIGENERRTAA
jgi:RNA polymerase sigma-32 factor